MPRNSLRIPALVILLASLFAGASHAQVTVAVDTALRYQTIEGWGHSGSAFAGMGGVYMLPDTTLADSLIRAYVDYQIDELGLTGSRIWEIGPRTDGTGMDHGDCDSIDWSRFQANSFNPWHYKWVGYFKERILALGFRPSFYSSPTYPTLATALKPWVLNHPGERAQQIWANALFWKNNYGVDIDYAVIFNEPSSPVTGSILAEDIRALTPRFPAHGLTTKTQFAEAVAPQTNWNFIQPVQNDAELWSGIGRISYHTYGTADPYRGYMKDFAASLGIGTAQTEMANPTFDDLYADLTIANCSYWEVGFSSGNILPVKSGQTQFAPSATFFRLRQVMHYVRPGSVRISAAAGDPDVHALAFAREGKITTILESATTPKTITLTGLPQGTYAISQAAGGTTPFAELGLKSVGAGGSMTLDIIGNNGVTTVYPYPGVNLPPTIMTWGSDKGYLTGSESTITLSVAANDPERDKLTYAWKIFSQPPGANVIIASPDKASSSASGLTAAGSYVFTIDASDGVNTSTKKVYLNKYNSNPPPILGLAGFRMAAPYGLVFSGIGDTTRANIELPLSSLTLQAGVGDLAGTDFTGRGKWSLVSAPAGAQVKIDSTIYIYISIRANVTGMTVPGDYVFQVDLTIPGSPNLTARAICTVHPASAAPVIDAITPAPAILTLPESGTQISAATHDPDGDLLRHWWAVKSVPAGARPVFDHQGRTVTNVAGLTVAGGYTFTLRAFDDIHMTTRDVTIFVKNPATEVENLSAEELGIRIHPNPVTDELHVQFSDLPGEISKILLLNAMGQVLSERAIAGENGGIETIPFRAFPAGMYFLIAEGRGRMAVRKIIKR